MGAGKRDDTDPSLGAISCRHVTLGNPVQRFMLLRLGRRRAPPTLDSTARGDCPPQVVHAQVLDAYPRWRDCPNSGVSGSTR